MAKPSEIRWRQKLREVKHNFGVVKNSKVSWAWTVFFSTEALKVFTHRRTVPYARWLPQKGQETDGLRLSGFGARRPGI
ncbi:hypothetical protein KCP76_04760 [Salmonella enterica subsp. enterica serovar Weltevreden]|nr:hypothetical protein KCP76_04760 [Salmonella enterica subsp. enterica serovar Weltevreden]